MSRPIRVLLTISDLRGGGAEREFTLLVRRLARERFEPHLCFWRPIFSYEPPSNAAVHILKKTRPWHVVPLLGQLRRLIEEIEPQLIFSQLHYVNMVTGTALARARHRPRWICRQVNDPRREMRWPFVVWARRALRRADRAVGCCRGVSDAMVDYLRLEPARVATLKNLVDLQGIEERARAPLPIEPRADTFTVVHAGRLHPQKNQSLLLEAFVRLRGAAAELWMLGEGPSEGRLRNRARRLGIADQVRWLGFRENPYPFFKAASCFALSSDHEGLPNAVIEAMACGTPVVSTNCAYGPDELIEDGVCGRLTPVGDARAFGDALGELFEDRARARRWGAAARQRALVDFDTEASCEAYQALFEEVVNDRRGAG
jgi:glycosyltransferase involved in cell wall biosynthesis